MPWNAPLAIENSKYLSRDRMAKFAFRLQIFLLRTIRELLRLRMNRAKSVGMRTINGSIRRKGCSIGLCLVATLLQGCISPTQYARPGTDAAQLTSDTHACAQWDPVAKGIVLGIGNGAMAGAAVATDGASDRDAAAVAAVIGLVYGLVTGAVFAQEEVRDYDRCMQAKGYHAV
jgi:hypothetical protein